MNLGDPELELIDPTPNVHSLFVHFDKMFFWTKLESRAVVRWSKRMYSCAGVCSYGGRHGSVCDIALSEPLLKLRPRKDLIETLLHEMIHAFLFITKRDIDRDGHGPNFKAHMHRINKSAGLNISIYHSFHDEVEIYQTHWWRCNGPCQTRRPHFGIVRRTSNRAPGPGDYWWIDHVRKCGGKFIKIKEPQKEQNSKGKKNATTKPNADITKYITNNNIKTINNIQNNNKPVLKDSTNVTSNTKTKTNSSSTVVVSKKGVITAAKPPPKPIPVFTGTGNTLVNNNTGSKHYTIDVTETVRNIWANKQIPTKEPVKKDDPVFKKPINTIETGTFKKPVKVVGVSNPKKHKAESTDMQSPPTKMKKIEDYFNATLKDLYGDDYKLTQSSTSTKLVAVNVKVELVDCPVCSGKFSSEEINRHLDECLNKDIIAKLSKEGMNNTQETQPSHREPNTKITDKPKLKELVGVITSIPPFKPKAEFTQESINNNVIDLNFDPSSYTKTEKLEDRAILNEINCPDILKCFDTAFDSYKPDPSPPENANDNIIDLTHLDFDASDNNIDKKPKRKTESEATLRSENLVKKVVAFVGEMDEAIKVNLHNKRRNTVGFITTDRGDGLSSTVNKKEVKAGNRKEEVKTGSSKEEVKAGSSKAEEKAGRSKEEVKAGSSKAEEKAGSSKEEVFGQNCPCCGKKFDKPVEQHLDECLIFFDNNTTIPDEGPSTSFSNNTSIIEDEEDDIFDESQIFNETGTKTPCPCCMKMVEQDDMNSHLDECLLKS